MEDKKFFVKRIAAVLVFFVKKGYDTSYMTENPLTKTGFWQRTFFLASGFLVFLTETYFPSNATAKRMPRRGRR